MLEETLVEAEEVACCIAKYLAFCPFHVPKARAVERGHFFNSRRWMLEIPEPLNGCSSADGGQHRSSCRDGDAAMKVFAVPELLEHILYLAVISQQAEDRVREKQDRHDLCVLKMWPMPGCGDVSKGGICLFRIQRVNKTFRDTIQGSTKLKQLIYLAPRDNAKLKDEADLEEGRLALHKPLTAFLWGINFRTKKELLDLDAHKDAEEGVEALVTVLRDSIFSRRSTTPYKKIFGKCPKKWRRAQASWRKIKVCNARVPVPVRVVVQGEETWPDHALPMGDIVWDLDEEATLEHVFDLLSEFLKAVEDLRHGKDLHERSRAKKLLQFDERASSDRHQLESQLAIELKALEDALDREKSTRDDEVARLDAELRDMELKAFGIKIVLGPRGG
ncbi:unnamed protein product [Cercospora beticola]|nr:unnamed protein product [Cercospora beticola]